jgi:hypothetical protein
MLSGVLSAGSAAPAVMSDLQSQAASFQSRLASMGQPPFFDRPGGGFGNAPSPFPNDPSV